MSKFQINAMIRLQAPQNVGAVVNQIRQQLQGITATINVAVPPQGLRQLTAATKSVQNVSKVAKEATSHITSLGEATAFAGKRFIAFSIAGGAIIKFTQAIKQGVTEAITFEREMNKIAQATGSSAASVSKISQEISRLSTTFGVSSQQLSKAALVLAQAGLSADDTKKSLQALAKSDLAPTFENIANTTEAAVAIFQQFKVKAEGLESVLSSVNAVAAKFAVESSDITAAVRRTGGAFEAAGGSLNEFMALFTSVRQTTRESAESIATGFRTIFTRLQRVRTQNFLKVMGIDLQDVEGQFVGPYEAVRRLSTAMKSLKGTDPRFAQVIEELGGFRQISKVIPLIQQFSVAEKARGVAMAGTASLSEDAARAQETLAVQIQKTKEQFMAMIREMTVTGSFKGMVTFALKLAEAFTKIVSALTPLLPLITAFGALAIGRAIGPFMKNFTKKGGLGLASGGLVPGVGSQDTVPAQLTPGEFVLRKKAVQKIGPQNLVGLNRGGVVQHFAQKGKSDTGTVRPVSYRYLSETRKDKKGILTKDEKERLGELKGGTGQQFGAIFLSPGATKHRGRPVVGKMEQGVFDIKPTSEFPGGIQAPFVARSLSPKFSQQFNKAVETKLVGLVNNLGGKLASNVGAQSSPLGKDTIPNYDAMVGGIFEGAIQSLGVPFVDAKTSTKYFDFPSGLGPDVASKFGMPPGIPVDAKKIYGRDAIGTLKDKIVNWYKENVPAAARQPAAASQGFFLPRVPTGAAITGAMFDKMGINSGHSPGRIRSELIKQGYQEGVDFRAVPEGKKGTKWFKAAAGGTVPALLTPGEFVVDKCTAQKVGEPTLNMLNHAEKLNGGGFAEFRPKTTTRGKAQGNIGRRKQLMVQRLQFLKNGQQQNLLSLSELKELASLQVQMNSIATSRSGRFSKRFGFAKGGRIRIEELKARIQKLKEDAKLYINDEAMAASFDSTGEDLYSMMGISDLKYDRKNLMKLRKLLPKGTEAIGAGYESTVYKRPSGDAVRLQGTQQVTRPPIKEMLQATETGQLSQGMRGKNTIYEILPLVEDLSTTIAKGKIPWQRGEKIVQGMSKRMKRMGLDPSDVKKRNLALVGRKAKIIDPGSVMEGTSLKPDQLSQAQQLSAQYSKVELQKKIADFEALSGLGFDRNYDNLMIHKMALRIQSGLGGIKFPTSLQHSGGRVKFGTGGSSSLGLGGSSYVRRWEKDNAEYQKQQSKVRSSSFGTLIPKTGYASSTIQLLTGDPIVQHELNQRMKVENLKFLGAGVYGVAFQDLLTGNAIRIEDRDVGRLALPEVLQAIQKDVVNIGSKATPRFLTVEHLPFAPSLEDNRRSGQITRSYSESLKDEFKARIEDFGYIPHDAHEGNVGFKPGVDISTVLRQGVSKAADQLVAIDPDTFMEPPTLRREHLNSVYATFAKKIRALASKKSLPELRELRRSATDKMEKSNLRIIGTSNFEAATPAGEAKVKKLQGIKSKAALSQNIMMMAIREKMGRGKMARGGFVPGFGEGDTVPAMLTPGEFVVNKNSAKAIGGKGLRKLNRGGFAAGGAAGGGMGIAGFGFAFAGVSALISTFNGLNDTVDKVAQTFTSIGAQVMALVYVMKSTSGVLRKYSDIIAKGQEKVAALQAEKKGLATPELLQAKRNRNASKEARKVAAGQYAGIQQKIDLRKSGQTVDDTKLFTRQISVAEYNRKKAARDRKVQALEQQQKPFDEQIKKQTTIYNKSTRQMAIAKDQVRGLNKQISIEEEKIQAEQKYAKKVQIYSAVAAIGATGLVVAGGKFEERGRARLEAGAGGGQEFAGGKIVSGAGVGMGMGAAAGALFGPPGIAIGAFVGAVAGATYSLFGLSKEIGNIKTLREFNISIAKTGRVLDALGKGQTTFANAKVQVGKQTTQTIRDLGSKATSKETRQDILAKTREQLDGFNTYLNEAAKEAKNFDDFISRAGKDTFLLVARLSNIPYDEMTDSWKKTIDGMKKAKSMSDKLVKVQDVYTNQVRNIINIGQAFEGVSLTMQKFDNSLDTLMGFADGTAASFKMLDESARIGTPEKFFDAGKFNAIIERDIKNNPLLKTKFPGQTRDLGNTMSDEIQAADKAIQDLPSILLNLRNNLGGFDIETTVEKLMDSFDTAPKFVQDAIEQAARGIIGEEGKEATLIDSIRKDLMGTAKTLGASFDPLMEAGRIVSSKMVEEANRRSAYLDKLNSVIMKEIDLRNKGLDIQAQGEELMARAQSRPVNLGRLQELDTKRQANILGGAGMVNDPAKIGAALQEAQNTLRAKEAELQKKGIDTTGKLNEEIRTEQERVGRLNQALQFLSDIGGRTTVTMQKLERAQAKAAFKQDIATRLTFAETPGDLKSLGMTLGATRQAAAAGTITGVLPNMRSEVLAMLQQIGDVKLGALGGDSGTDIIKKLNTDMLTRAGFSAEDAKAIADGQSSDIEKLRVELESQTALARAANDQLLIINKGTKDEIIKQYQASVLAFGGEIQKVFDKQKEAQLKKEVGDTTSNKERLIRSRTNLSEMAAGLGTTDAQARIVGENLPLIKEYQKEMKNATRLSQFISDRKDQKKVTETSSWGPSGGLGKTILKRLDRSQLGVDTGVMSIPESIQMIAKERAIIEADSGNNAKVLAAFDKFMDDQSLTNVAAGTVGYVDLAASLTQAIDEARNVAEKESVSSDTKNRIQALGLTDIIPRLTGEMERYEKLYAGIVDNGSIGQLDTQIAGLVRTIIISQTELERLPEVAKRKKEFEQKQREAEAAGRMPQPDPNFYARGGFVSGRGNRDSISARLTPGEFVLSRPMVQAIGKENLAQLAKGGKILDPTDTNIMKYGEFAGGGAKVVDYPTGGGIDLKSANARKAERIAGVKSGISDSIVSSPLPQPLVKPEDMLPGQYIPGATVPSKYVPPPAPYPTTRVADIPPKFGTVGITTANAFESKALHDRIAKAKVDEAALNARNAFDPTQNMSQADVNKLYDKQYEASRIQMGQTTAEMESEKARNAPTLLGSKTLGELSAVYGLGKQAGNVAGHIMTMAPFLADKGAAFAGLTTREEMIASARKNKDFGIGTIGGFLGEALLGDAAIGGATTFGLQAATKVTTQAAAKTAAQTAAKAAIPKIAAKTATQTTAQVAEKVTLGIAEQLPKIKPNDVKKMADLQRMMKGVGPEAANAQNIFGVLSKKLRLSDEVIASFNEMMASGSSTRSQQKILERIQELNKARGYSSGSLVPGFGSGDKVPALLEPGEFVFNRNAVAAVGAGKLAQVNQRFGRYRSGGPVKMASGGGVMSINASAMERAVQVFGQQIDKFAASVNSMIGLSIDLRGTHEVNVTFNGLAVMAGLQDSIQKLIVTETDNAIRKMLNDTFNITYTKKTT